MVWESAPIDENVTRLESLGVQSTVFDPCGNVPEDGDFLEVMRRNTANLRRALEDQPLPDRARLHGELELGVS